MMSVYIFLFTKHGVPSMHMSCICVYTLYTYIINIHDVCIYFFVYETRCTIYAYVLYMCEYGGIMYIHDLRVNFVPHKYTNVIHVQNLRMYFL